MPNFKPYDYNQSAVVIINYLDQLQPGTFEHTLHHLLDSKLDLSAFYPNYNNDKGGRAAYDPAILLKIILFAYSKGITSSREIQWSCETNIIFKALSCDSAPHWTTIAAFVSSYSEEIEALFEQLLLVCDEQGLLGKELFAIDGCKLPSNAAKEWSGTFSELEKKREKIGRQIRHHIEQHKALDKTESGHEERERRTQQTIDTLNKAHEKIDKFLKTSGPRMGKGRKVKEVKSNITDNESAKMTTSKGTLQGYTGVATVDMKHQVIVDAQAFGEGQEYSTLQPVLNKIKTRFSAIKIAPNIYATDVVVTADTGFANEANMAYLYSHGINAYIPDNLFRQRDPKFAEQKAKYPKPPRKNNNRLTIREIPASEFSFDPVARSCHCPAGNLISYRKTREDMQGNLKAYFEGKLSQCRHCEIKQKCMRNPDSTNHRKGKGRQVSFMVRKSEKSTFTDWMKHRIDSPKGKEIYGHRMAVVEPVFGNITTNKGLRRFSLRSKRKVQGQWVLYCMVHNIEKVMNYGNLKNNITNQESRILKTKRIG
jgi:transposase